MVKAAKSSPCAREGKKQGVAAAKTKRSAPTAAPASRGDASAVPSASTSRTSSAAKVGAVVKCRRCNCLSSQRRWYETVQTVDKKGVTREQASGTACFECGALHAEGFNHLTWKDFCDQAQSSLREAAEEASVVKSGGQPTFERSEVASVREIFLELRTPVQVLDAAQVRGVLGRSRLPAHLKSVPTLQTPTSAGSSDSGSNGVERVYCFADPKEPYRTATLVERIGATTTRPEMRTQLWQGQADAMLRVVASKQSEEHHTSSIIKAKRLPTLKAFLSDKGIELDPDGRPIRKKKSSSSKHGGQASGDTPLRRASSCFAHWGTAGGSL